MLLFAIVFAGLAVLGALVGVGEVGHPIRDQAIDCYGWALCINAVALAAFMLFVRRRRARHPTP